MNSYDLYTYVNHLSHVFTPSYDDKIEFKYKLIICHLLLNRFYPNAHVNWFMMSAIYSRKKLTDKVKFTMDNCHPSMDYKCMVTFTDFTLSYVLN